VDSGRSILYGVCAACQTNAPDECEPGEHACPCGCGKTKHRVRDYGLTR
jgi:hypothetical protein